MRTQLRRVASVSVLGQPQRRLKSLTGRLDLLVKVVDAIILRWPERRLDAVLFPAGFFKILGEFGPLDGEQRQARLEACEVGDACLIAARRLYRVSCGVLVVGIETRPFGGFSGDQMMVAWTPKGVTGIARKVFTSDADTNEENRKAYLLFEADFDDRRRIIKTPNGEPALLCVCYDAFVLAEGELGPTPKRSAMRYVHDDDYEWRWLEAEERNRLLAAFKEMVEEAEPTIVLVGLHGFERPGRETYWQRHGIASSSAALNGALVVGAAHFQSALPDPRDLHHAALASVHVPASHLPAGLRRRAQRLGATDAFIVSIPGAPHLAALVSLVEG